MNPVKKSFIRSAAATVALAMCSISGAWAVPQFNPATGHWYDLVSSLTDGSWHTAESNAVGLGGHLVTINDAAEETWLRNAFSTTTRYWIGYNDFASEGNFVWSSGETPGYTNWGGGEPNNAQPPAVGEDYAVLNWQSSGQWNDWSHLRSDYNNANLQGIAEWARVPEPASLALLGFGLLGLGFARRRTR